MPILILFAFLAGVITIFSPCILPMLPLILSGSVGGRSRPWGIILGFFVSFTFFTLSLATLVQAFGLSADLLRQIAALVIVLLGVVLLLPGWQVVIEKWFGGLQPLLASTTGHGFLRGLLLGVSLGLIWTPCVGPILAAVITLAASSEVSLGAVMITMAYALGNAIPMLGLMLGGRSVATRFLSVQQYTELAQKVFGLVMILVGIGLWFGIERAFQTWVLSEFPQYGRGLTAIEELPFVQNALKGFRQQGK